MKLKKTLENFKSNKNYAILICILFVSGMLVGKFSEPFRMNRNLRWIYESGKLISFGLFFGSLFWSLVNSIMLINESKHEWKKRLIWVFISALPILYFVIMMTITMTYSIK